jgi:hypothetical protein
MGETKEIVTLFIVIPIQVGTSHQSEKLGFTTVQPNLPVSFLLGITIIFIPEFTPD